MLAKTKINKTNQPNQPTNQKPKSKQNPSKNPQKTTKQNHDKPHHNQETTIKFFLILTCVDILKKNLHF